MEAKIKAEELIENFRSNIGTFGFVNFKRPAIQCAILCVKEIIETNPLEPTNVDWDDCGATHKYWYETMKTEARIFWNEVLTELNKM